MLTLLMQISKMVVQHYCLSTWNLKHCFVYTWAQNVCKNRTDHRMIWMAVLQLPVQCRRHDCNTLKLCDVAAGCACLLTQQWVSDMFVYLMSLCPDIAHAQWERVREINETDRIHVCVSVHKHVLACKSFPIPYPLCRSQRGSVWQSVQ